MTEEVKSTLKMIKRGGKWILTDGVTSGCGFTPQQARSAFNSAREETKAFEAEGVELNKQQKLSLERVVEYLADEDSHYHSCKPVDREDHIWPHVVALHEALGHNVTGLLDIEDDD